MEEYIDKTLAINIEDKHDENKTTEPKKKPAIPKLTPDLLLEDNGIQFIMDNIAEKKYKTNSPDQALLQLIGEYDMWAKKLYPAFNFDDFTKKIEAQSGAVKVRKMLQNLRAGDPIDEGIGRLDEEREQNRSINLESAAYEDDLIDYDYGEWSTKPNNELPKDMQDLALDEIFGEWSTKATEANIAAFDPTPAEFQNEVDPPPTETTIFDEVPSTQLLVN